VIRSVSISFLLLEEGKHVAVANSSQWSGSNELEAKASAGTSFSEAGAAVMVGFALFTVLL
jgi:hypothetical protein